MTASSRTFRSASLSVFATLLMGCTSGRDRAGSGGADSSATKSTATSAELSFTGDFQGPLGVQLWTFRDAMKGNVAATLEQVRSLGFREVELAGTYGMSATDFRHLLDSVGLRATSMHVGYERFRDSLPAVLADAKALGVPFLGTAWIPHPDGPLTLTRVREAAADFNKWGKAARDEGIRFFYHTHGYEFRAAEGGVIPFDLLMRETDADAVKFEMDVFWTALPGVDPVAMLQKYPGRWRLMHLKDMKQGVARTVHTGGANPDSSEVPVGTG
ncbi:MAG: sugar phosphate isomerase/epimerase, partial [Gemmatimonadaceae bacterium]